MEEWFDKEIIVKDCDAFWKERSKTYKNPISRESIKVIRPLEMHDCNLAIHVNIFIPEDIMQYYFWGKLPLAMGDKSYCFCEGNYMYWHRSWTGKMVFKVSFTHVPNGYRVTEIVVPQDESVEIFHRLSFASWYVSDFLSCLGAITNPSTDELFDEMRTPYVEYAYKGFGYAIKMVEPIDANMELARALSRSFFEGAMSQLTSAKDDELNNIKQHIIKLLPASINDNASIESIVSAFDKGVESVKNINAQKYYGNDKLFLTFSKQPTLSYSTILQNIMIMLIHEDSDEFLTNSEALEALNGLSQDDYDNLLSRAETMYSDFDTQRYLDNRRIRIGMYLNELDEEEVDSFMNDVSEIFSWSDFVEYELPEVEW